MGISPWVQQWLARYDLQSLTQWVTNSIVDDWTPEQLEIEIEKRPEYRTRFPAIFELRAKGIPYSPDEYISYEKTAQALAAMWGMPLSKKETDKLQSGQVSNVELERRFDLAAAAVYSTPQETRDELARMHGVSYGEQMKYWMNPKEELGNLQQKFRTAELSGAAIRSGFGQLNFQEALKLSDAGLTREQALTGFGQLVEDQALFTPLDASESAISREQQIAFLQGDKDVEVLIENTRQRRLAQNEAGGTFTTTREGFSTGSAR